MMGDMPPTQNEKGADFRALHDGDPFVIPNPWDAGSAKVLAGLGFKALASTSSGFAYTLGRPDGAATLDEVVEHAGALDRATSLPVSVDLENGYGPTAQDVARAVARVAGAGAVGASIEDCDPSEGIYPLDDAAERVAAAVEASQREGEAGAGGCQGLESEARQDLGRAGVPRVGNDERLSLVERTESRCLLILHLPRS